MLDFKKYSKTAHKLLLEKVNTKTNWVIITGPPSSGKTTLINSLSMDGFMVCNDDSRIILEEYKRLGVSPHKTRENEKDFQHKTFLKMMYSASLYKESNLVFFDYALPCNLAFYKASDIEPPLDVVRSAKTFKFKLVFLLHPLKFEKDGVRTEEESYQQKVYILLERVYNSLGYNVIKLQQESTEALKQKILEIALTNQ